MNRSENKPLNQRLVTPVLMWILVLTGIILIFSFTPVYRLFARSIPTILLFLATFVNWLYFFLGAIAKNRTAPLNAASRRK